LLFVMELATRRVHFAGSTTNPDELWMVQMACNLSDAEDGFLRRKKFLMMDRDAKFSEVSLLNTPQACGRRLMTDGDRGF
jgi:putative transposase